MTFAGRMFRPVCFVVGSFEGNEMMNKATRIAQAYYGHVTDIVDGHARIRSKRKRAMLVAASHKAGAVCEISNSWTGDTLDKAQSYFLAMAALRPRVTGLSDAETSRYETAAVRATIAELREQGVEITVLDVAKAVKRDARRWQQFE